MADTSTVLDLFANGNSGELFTLDDTPDSLGTAVGNSSFGYSVVYTPTAFNKGIQVDGSDYTTALSTDYYFNNVSDKTISLKFSMSTTFNTRYEILASDADRYYANFVILISIDSNTDTLNAQFGNGTGSNFSLGGVDVSAFRGDGILHTVTASNAGDECYLWLDGVLVNQGTSPSSLSNISSNTGNGYGMLFGTMSTVRTGATDVFNGVIDQPRILYEAITTADKAQVLHYEDDSYWSAVTEAPSAIIDFSASDDIEGYVQMTFTPSTGLPVPTHDLYTGINTLLKTGVINNYAYPIAGGNTDDYFVKAVNSVGDTDSNIDSGTSLLPQTPPVQPFTYLGDDIPVSELSTGDEQITRIALGDTEIWYWLNISDKVYPSGIRTVRVQDYADKEGQTIIDYVQSQHDSKVPADGALNRDIFSSYTEAGTSVYNQTAIDLDLSGVSHSQDQAGALITPQHMVVAEHYRATIGTVIYFHDLAGVSYARTIIAEQAIEGTPTFGANTSDGMVQKLNAPLPASVKVYPILADVGYTALTIVGAKSISLDKLQHVNVAEVMGVGTVANELSYLSHGPTADYVYDAPEFNDSGSPSFVIVNGELAITSTLTSSYITTSDMGGANYGDTLYLLLLDEIVNTLGY